MNLVGGSRGRRPFKKGKKKIYKKGKKVQNAPGPSQTRKFKVISLLQSASTARRRDTGRGTILFILRPLIRTGRGSRSLLNKVFI